jgi:hypothetical protein
VEQNGLSYDDGIQKIVAAALPAMQKKSTTATWTAQRVAAMYIAER